MPTRAGIGAGVLAVAGFVAGRLFGIFELYIVAAALLALVGCAMAWVLLNWRSLVVSRRVEPARLHVGETSQVTLSLTNRRLVPTPVAQVTDEVEGTPRADAHVPPLRRDQVTRASYRVAAERRGRLSLGPMRTRVTDPFALASTVRNSAPDAAVLVLPAFDRIAPPPQPSGTLAMKTDRSPGRIGPNGDEFSALRPYVMGDDMRKVHWPSTARTGDLVVRTEHVPEHGDTLVLLDVRARVADPETFERMVSAATSVLVACHERGDSLRLVTTAGSDLHADSERSFDRILDHLALITQSSDSSVAVATGGGAIDSAVAVLGSSHGFLDALGPQQALPPTTIILQFLDDGAKPAATGRALPSRRMAAIALDDDFATVWAEISHAGAGRR